MNNTLLALLYIAIFIAIVVVFIKIFWKLVSFVTKLLIIVSIAIGIIFLLDYIVIPRITKKPFRIMDTIVERFVNPAKKSLQQKFNKEKDRLRQKIRSSAEEAINTVVKSIKVGSKE